MLEKINFIPIITAHLDTLYDNSDGSRRSNIFLFIILPIVISIIIVILTQFRLNQDIINLLITSFSVFTALLFNLLLLVYDIISRNGSDEMNADLKKVNRKNKVINETFTNISFCILISIIILVLIISLYFGWQINFEFPYSFTVSKILTILILSGIGIFFLSLFMVLKRIFTLIVKESKIVPTKPA